VVSPPSLAVALLEHAYTWDYYPLSYDIPEGLNKRATRPKSIAFGANK
jgi:hypothetical protein